MRLLREPPRLGAIEVESLEDGERADALVAKYIEELGLPTYPVDPPTRTSRCTRTRTACRASSS